MSKRKYHPDFIQYLQQYPDQLNYAFTHEQQKLNRKYNSDPSFRALADSRFPDPQQRMTALAQQAAMNADASSKADLALQQKRYGIKSLNQDDLKEAFNEHYADYEPSEHVKKLAQENGIADPVADYRQNILPKTVNEQVSRVAPYLFPPQPESAPTPQQPQAPMPPPRAAPVVQRAPVPQTDMQGSSFSGAEGAPPPPPAPPQGGGGNEPTFVPRGMYAPGTENM